MNLNIIKNCSCRVCLSTKCDITVSFVENKSLLALYKFCTDILVDLKIPPLRVCSDCIEIMHNFASFKRKCEESEEFWKNTLNMSYQQEDAFKIVDGSNDDNTEPNNTENMSNRESELCKIQHGSKGDNVEMCKIQRKKDNSYNDNVEIDLGNNIVYNEKLHENDALESVVMFCKQKIYNCRMCKRQFKYFKCLNNHKCTKKLHENKTKQGIKEINNEKDLIKYNHSRIYKQNSEKNERENNCGLCKLSFNDKMELRDHLNKHSSDNVLKCEMCGFDGPDFAKMISHRYSHLRQRVWCHECDQHLTSARVLEYHYRSAHLHRPGQCGYCSRVCNTYHSWSKHDRVHSAKRLFICDLCDRRFLYKHQIVAHLVDHSDVRDYICETCGSGFKRPTALRNHIESVHQKNQPVICDHCDGKFKNKKRLELHLRRVTKNGPHKCPVCPKRFSLECYMKYHLAFHSDEKPHVCEICGLKYKQRTHLRVHMRNHTGERPFKCDVCGKEFTTSHQAKRHLNVHAGVPKHKCGSCEQSFLSLKALLEHSVQHKREDDLKVI